MQREYSTKSFKLLHSIVNGYKGNPSIAILMSGTGSNAVNILENREKYPNLDINCIVTDKPNSNASSIAHNYKLTYIEHVGSVGTDRARKSYFVSLANKLRAQHINFVLYAGFMKVATKNFVVNYPGINVHPSDMLILDETGLPKYRGMNAIEEAVDAGEDYIASTAYVVDETIDAGIPIAVTKHISLLGKNGKDLACIHQGLKVSGEHVLYPQLLEALATGQINLERLPIQTEFLPIT